MRAMRVPPRCRAATRRVIWAAACSSACRSAACSICTVMRWEWLARKLNRSSASRMPSTWPCASSTASLCTRAAATRASPSWSSARTVNTGWLANSPTASRSSGRPSRMARCSVVPVKMPRPPCGSPDQHAGRALCMEQAHHGDDVGGRIHHMSGTQIGLVHARQRQRLQFVPVCALGQCAQLVAQVGEQQGAKGRVARDQLAHGFARKLVGDEFLGHGEAAACAAGHQGAAVEAVVGAVAGQDLVALGLHHMALDDDEEVGGRRAGVQHHGALGEVGDVHAIAHQRLFVGREAVEGRGGEVEGVGHGAGPLFQPAIQTFRPCSTLAAASQPLSNQLSPSR